MSREPVPHHGGPFRRWIFVSDLHLRGPADPNQALFLRFLADRVASRLDTQLVVAGDLFDFWLGLEGHVPEACRPVVEALEALPSVLWLEGNHDMRIERSLGRTPRGGLQVCSGAVDLRCGDLRVRVEHGDLVDPEDRGYRLLRRVLRSQALHMAARFTSPRLLHVLGAAGAQRWRGVDKDYSGREPHWLALSRTYAGEVVPDRADVLVLGHGHYLGWWKEALVCLGDWLGFYSYLEISEDRSCALKRYEVSSDEDEVLCSGPVGEIAPRL